MPYGTQLFPGLQRVAAGAGFQTDVGTFTGTGGKVVAYVHHSGRAVTDDENIAKMTLTTLNAALRLCRSGKGDVVMVLPGHAENISSADQMSNLVAGTKIVGLGHANLRPTFTWTAATSTFLLDVANVELNNLILNMDPGAGSVNVAAPITISAAGCAIRNCKIRMGTDANSLVTIGITTTAAADDLEIVNCEIYGATAAECTTQIRFVGADRLKFIGNTLVGATSSTTIGNIQFLTTASTDIKMFDVTVRNNKAASTAAITGLTGTSGEVDYLTMFVLGNGANQLVLGNAAGAWSANADGMMFGLNVGVVNLAGESAARATPLSA